jgi:rod shape-determining protein MreC
LFPFSGGVVDRRVKVPPPLSDPWFSRTQETPNVRLKETARVPLLLLACLTTALLFPRACAGARTGVAGALLGTAELTGGVRTPESQVWKEKLAATQHDLARLRQDQVAMGADEGGLDLARIERPDPSSRLTGVLARVLHRDASVTRRSFLIDVGTDQGVRRGLPVVCGRSLVGVVETVSAGAARVLRVDDVSVACRFPAVLMSLEPRAGTDEGPPAGRGVCQGTADGRLVVSFLAKSDARTGDVAMTGAGRYPVPEGWVLGEVESVADEDRDGDWEAVVRPLRDLDELTSVMVLRQDELPPQVRPK